MSNNKQLYDASRRILAESLESFRLPTPMSTFNEDEIRKLFRLVWALQIILKDVLEDLDVLGNTKEIIERIEHLEKTIAFSKGIMTSDEACEHLGICKSQLYKLVHTQDLPTYKASSKSMFFKVEDVVDWVISHPLKRGSRPIENTGLIDK